MFKITRTQQIPPGAETRVHNGEKQARIRHDGKMIWVKINDRGRVIVQSVHYHARVGGRIIRLYRDKSASEAKLHAMRIHAEKVENGLALPLTDVAVTVSQLVEEYTENLKLAGRKESTYGRLPSVLSRLFADLGIKNLKDLRGLSRPRLEKWVSSFEGAPATAKYFLQRLQSFLGFLAGRQLIGTVPPFPVIKATPTRSRAVLTPEVEAKLFAAVPLNRRLLYTLMISTGARCGAAASILAGDLDLDRVGGPVVSLRAERQKNGKGLMVPLPRKLADELAKYSQGMKADDRLFGIPSGNMISRFFAIDLKKAKIPAMQPDGTLSAHSLRHTFACRLLKAGTSPALVAALGNWKTLQLLMRVYGHLVPSDGRSSVESVFGK